MARVKRGVTAHAKHKKTLKAAKGFYGRRKNTDRKVLSDMAIHEPAAFGALVEASKKALAYLKEAGTTNEFETAVR